MLYFFMLLAVAACDSDSATVATDTTTTAPTTPSVANAPSTTEWVLPRVEVPMGVLAAMPQQNREDPAKGQFQLQIINGTSERLRVVSVQFVWVGLSTPVAVRDDTVVAGQRIDFPVKLPVADCVGDGTIADMPDIGTATATVGLDDGTQLTVPVFDTFGVARKLYLRDCDRQLVERSVQLEWADLAEVEFDGRPVTEGVLRMTRLDNDNEIRIFSAGNTIPFVVVLGDDEAPGEALAVLPHTATQLAEPVRFVEGRCDAHAVAEVKQPFKFILQIDLGDGVLHPYVLMPLEPDRVPMQQTAVKACTIRGEDGMMN